MNTLMTPEQFFQSIKEDARKIVEDRYEQKGQDTNSEKFNQDVLKLLCAACSWIGAK